MSLPEDKEYPEEHSYFNSYHPFLDIRLAKPTREWVNEWCDAHPFGLLPRTFDMDSLFKKLEDYLK